MNIRSKIAGITLLSLFVCAEAGAANEYSPLLRTKRFAEAEKLANARLAQEPANADALVAKAKAILGAGPVGRIEEAVKLGEQCVAAHPQQSQCHLAWGNALGAKAMNGGMMSAMRYAGTIRDAFLKAVELDPRNTDARFSLLEFYLQAPGIVGGGKDKAQTLATQTAAVNLDASKLLLAHLDITEGQLAKAEAALLAVQPGNDEMAMDRQRFLLTALANRYLNDKKYADSERVFRVVQKRFPESETGLYGLARVLQEQGQYREAIASYEQALAILDLAAIHYRIGQSALALNDKARAASEFAKALAIRNGLSAKMQSDAQEQLKALRG